MEGAISSLPKIPVFASMFKQMYIPSKAFYDKLYKEERDLPIANLVCTANAIYRLF